MSNVDTSREAVGMAAYQMRHMPDASLTHESTREDFAVLFLALLSERDELREALRGVLAAMEATTTDELTDSEISQLWNAALEQGEAVLGEEGGDA